MYQSLSLQILIYTPFVFSALYILVNFIARTPRHVCMIVLGDIGRSPRMQYHALSFAKEGFKVYLVGYQGSTPLAELVGNEKIVQFHMREPPAILSRLPKIFTYILKVVWQATSLAWTLLLIPKTSSTFIQNPPSIPTMLVAYVVCRLRFSQLVIDWHNYGHTILAMALSPSHPLLKFAKWYEHICGRLSDYNICVTQAMKEDLKQNWSVRATTVHDRPPKIFRSISTMEQHNLFTKLAKQYPVFNSRDEAANKTIFTELGDDGSAMKLEDRPAMLVSSTSWTEDEDFGILLNALKEYDSSSDTVPELICVITGKGPQKEFYIKKIEEGSWSSVKFCLPWLEPEDYPLMLGSADLGVSLHTSSSGLDLPMKVVDMFGCGLPVCAANFKCIGELVNHNKNGLVFNNSDELAEQLKDLLGRFPSSQAKLENFRANLKTFQSLRWHPQWTELVLPMFQEIGRGGQARFLTNIRSGGGLPDDFDQIGRSGGGDGSWMKCPTEQEKMKCPTEREKKEN